ncbi:MAG: MerR family transcriptional regulator [Clostridiales bacterium]|nr:MerR family transcriptional regulator [Clostridiales bacterium]
MILINPTKDIFYIKEVSEITGFKPHVIRFYENEFQLEIPRKENKANLKIS